MSLHSYTPVHRIPATALQVIALRGPSMGPSGSFGYEPPIRVDVAYREVLI